MARTVNEGDSSFRGKSPHEQDFILLSEFAEIRHGPQPICTIPSGANGSFDISSFSVRIFSTDFQQGQSEEFSLSPDSQVLLTELHEGMFAYVHYFALNDIQARGYMRQYSLCYLTSSPTKLTDNFEKLQNDFSEITGLFKCGNHRVFGQDLEHRLADLEYSLQVVNEMKDDNKDMISKYDGSMEDIPESNSDVLKRDIEFTKMLMNVMDKEMQTDFNIRLHQWIETQRFYHHTTNVIRTEGNSLFYTSQQPYLEDTMSYVPKRVMAHLSERFTRQLRSLEELSVEAYSLAMSALHNIHKKYNRSELTLAMEHQDIQLLKPLSSLLTMGRVPFTNVLKDDISDSPSLYKVTSLDQHDIIMTTDQTCLGFDTGFLDYEQIDKATLYLDPLPRQQRISVIDPLATPSVTSPPNSQLFPQYQGATSQGSSYNTPETIPSPPPEYDNEESTTFPQVNHSQVVEMLQCVNDINDGAGLHVDGRESQKSEELTKSLPSNGVSCHHYQFTQSLGSSKKLVQLPKLRIPSSITTGDQFFIPQVTTTDQQQHSHWSHLPNSHGHLPFLSSVDLIENSSPYKPGKDLLVLFKDIPEMRDILYSILHGRPFVIIASPRDEKLVGRYIRALWLFVAGHTSHYQIIPWQTKALDLEQLPLVRLVGVASPTYDRLPPIPDYLKKHVSYWDWTNNILCTPTYSGHLLNPMLTRIRDKKSEDLLLALIQSILLDFSLKSFLYFHGFCLQSELPSRRASPPEISARKFHAVTTRKDKAQFLSLLSVKEGDADIVEHLTDVLCQQQLNEWSNYHHTVGLNKVPLKVMLKGHYSQEKVCKPKRPNF